MREVIAAAGKVAGKAIDYEQAPRREGDPATLVASSGKARALLGWTPAWTELEPIIESAWRWHSAQAY
ncbi:UDP-glucose 4-epimerase [compost metagenome]